MTQFGAAYPFYFSPQSVPVLPLLTLSDDEKATIARLQTRTNLYQAEMLLADAYYRGMQIVRDLGIAIPPELRGLRTLTGVPTLAVDPIVDRSALDGFRHPGQTELDQELTDIFNLNGWDAEQALAFTDTKVFGRSYVTVGSPDEPGDVPRICVESPLNMSVLWDVRSYRPRASLQSFWLEDRRHAAVMLPDQTIDLAENDDGQWEITNRDIHNFGEVPLRRLANRPRTNMRDGYSAITPALMSVTDAMCRTLLGLEVAREFYSVPQKLILGATESDFQNADGTSKSAWSTYISSVLALERDEEGQLPEVKQFDAYDPATFTKLHDMYCGIAAGILGVPAQYVGLYTQGNPISAEAAQVSESRLDRQANRDMAGWSAPLRGVAQLALRFANGGSPVKDAEKLYVDWKNPTLLSIAQVADAIGKWDAAGTAPGQSDVVRKRAGFTPLEREQLRKEDNAAQLILDDIGTSIEGKLDRSANALAKAAAPQPGVPAPVAPPAP